MKEILCILLFGICCYFTIDFQTNKVKMTLSIKEKKITQNEQFIDLRLSLKNVSNGEIWILNFPQFSTGTDGCFQIRISKDGKRKIIPKLIKRKVPKKSNYIKLNQGEELIFNYQLDMTLLRDSNNRVKKMSENNDFGIYTMKVLFRDHYLKKTKAIRSLESNEIKLSYMH